MRISRWFTLGPYDDEDGRKHHWYNKTWEYNWERVRLLLGDLHQQSEEEGGGDIGPSFSIELSLAQEDIPEFYVRGNDRADYDIYWITAIVWRWGIYLSFRGKIKDAV